MLTTSTYDGACAHPAPGRSRCEAPSSFGRQPASPPRLRLISAAAAPIYQHMHTPPGHQCPCGRASMLGFVGRNCLYPDVFYHIGSVRQGKTEQIVFASGARSSLLLVSRRASDCFSTWRGATRQDQAGLGKAGHGWAWQARLGMARSGGERSGLARYGRHGTARLGWARCGVVWLAADRPGKARQAWRGKERQGGAGRGRAWQGRGRMAYTRGSSPRRSAARG